jgi:hypothetical protein
VLPQPNGRLNLLHDPNGKLNLLHGPDSKLSLRHHHDSDSMLPLSLYAHAHQQPKKRLGLVALSL